MTELRVTSANILSAIQDKSTVKARHDVLMSDMVSLMMGRGVLALLNTQGQACLEKKSAALSPLVTNSPFSVM